MTQFRCVVHGPSPVIVQDEQPKCQRCVKRPVKIRDNTHQVTFLLKSDIPVNVARLEKKRIVEKKQWVKEAYLQVTVVPEEASKEAASLKKAQEKRAKVKEEVAEIKRKRDDRMREVCRAYALGLPYFYSRFVSHPDWVQRRQQDTSEYLHNVQAVIQSFERRDNLKSLADMKTKENNLYRTTKLAAWRVFHIREADVPPAFDIHHDQAAAASFRDCISKMDGFAGEKPRVTVADNCHPSYWSSPRASGVKRRHSVNTYRAEKYRLQGYRHQRVHKYPAPYMVKGAVKMNQVLCPKGVGKRNFAIMRHMRTAGKVRELFYSHNKEFHREFKQQLAEHAANMDDPKIKRKWEAFVKKGTLPDHMSQLSAMTSFVAADKLAKAAKNPDAAGRRPFHTCPNCCEFKLPQPKSYASPRKVSKQQNELSRAKE